MFVTNYYQSVVIMIPKHSFCNTECINTINTVRYAMLHMAFFIFL